MFIHAYQIHAMGVLWGRSHQASAASGLDGCNLARHAVCWLSFHAAVGHGWLPDLASIRQ